MARVSAQQAAQKWTRNLSGASQDIQAGIDRVTSAPGAKAAASSGKWLAKVTTSEDKFKRNVGRVSLGDWQAAAKAGVSRVAAGAQAKQGKMESFMNEFLAHLDRGAAAINSMPTNTLEDGVNKAAAQIRHNAQFRRQA